MTERTQAELKAALEETYEFFSDEKVADILRHLRRLHVLSLFHFERLMMLSNDGLGDGFEIIYHRVLDHPPLSHVVEGENLAEAIAGGPFCPACGEYNGAEDQPHVCRRPQ